MNHLFKSRYDEMKESADALSSEKEAGGKDEAYINVGYTRNVCFVLPDGDEIFLNYAYLVRGRHFVEDGRIVLVFTSDTVTLKGIRLKKLFTDFQSNIPFKVISQPERYNEAEDEETPIVNEIIVNTTS